jgi:hypothetical protein
VFSLGKQTTPEKITTYKSTKRAKKYLFKFFGPAAKQRLAAVA